MQLDAVVNYYLLVLFQGIQADFPPAKLKTGSGEQVNELNVIQS